MNRSVIILLLASFGVFFLGMTAFGVTDPGEGYYVEAAREMAESGDFTTPHLNYQIYFSKPILTFWLIAVPYKLFGVSEFSARIAFSFLATILVFATFWTGRLILGRYQGLLAGLMIATAPLLVAVTRLSPIDIAFTAFLDISVFSFAITALLGNQRWWPAFYVALALAVLTKGPAAVVLFLIGLIAFLVVYRPGKSELTTWFERMQPGYGSAIFWLIVLPWHFAVQQATDSLFLFVFFFYENYARFQGHTNLARTEWWYYFPVIAYGFAPWILFIPPALKDAFALRLKSLSPREMFAFGKNPMQPPQLSLLFLAVWAVAEFAFFCQSRTKMDTYILPSFAPLAVLAAWKVGEWSEAMSPDLAGARSKWLLACIFLSGIAAVALALAPVALTLTKALTPPMKVALSIASLIMAMGAALFVWNYKKDRLRIGFYSLALAMAVAATIATPFAFQYGSKLRWDDLKVIAESLRGTEADVAIYNTFRPAVMFYARKPVDSFFHAHQLEPRAAGDDGRQFVIASDRTIHQLISHPGINLKPVNKQGQWGLYEAVGSRLRKNITLEEIFKQPAAFEMAITGKADWGPLTVPYAAGDPEKVRAGKSM